MSTPRDMFPFLTEHQYAIAESLRQAVGDNLAIAMLREAGSPEGQGDLLHAFAAHDSETVRDSPTMRPRTVKLQVPKYSGKDSENLLRWLVQVEKGANALLLTSESMRVDYALSFLGGRAEDWALTRCMSDPHCFPTYASFELQLKDMFLPPNCDFRARSEFLASKQGSKPLLSYIQELRVLLATLVEPISESTKVTVFMRGVRVGPARTQLFRMYPQSLEEAFKIAQTEEYSHAMARGVSPAMTVDPNDMDVSSTEARDLSKTKCFNCGRLGHMSRACPLPRRANDNRTRGDNNFGRRNDNRRVSFTPRVRQGNAHSQ